jgi:class 3 adenylate cyclase
MGETPKLAARLQGVTDPDQLVVANSTRQLCGDVFDFRTSASAGRKPNATVSKGTCICRNPLTVALPLGERSGVSASS